MTSLLPRKPIPAGWFLRALALRALVVCATVAAMACAAASDEAAPAPMPTWHRGLFRVNSDISSGSANVETIAAKANAEGMAFIVFADQFLVRAEYGLPPFRRALRVVREQDSVSRYGVAAYLARLNRLQLEHPELTVIAGVDVAPALWWSGNPWRGDLTAHQFSQQMTVFGPEDAAFYRDLPVMLSSRPGWRFPGTLLGLLPLLLGWLGWWLWRARPVAYYEDRQGNCYAGPRWPRRALGVMAALIGIAWTWDNRPFTIGPEWSPYGSPDRAPFQAVCDHVRARGGDEAGVIWAHPEITMRQSLPGVTLITTPYLEDVLNTFGHNGMAGIYGDAFKAHAAGREWDRMLDEYVGGMRRERPVIVGESDYHGGDRPLTIIQTVIRTVAPGRRAVLRALLAGHSYAIFRDANHRLVLDEAVLTTPTANASLGETVIWDGRHPLALHLRGHLDGPPPPPGAGARLSVILDGREIANQILDLPVFDVAIPVSPVPAGDLQMHYVRFHVHGTGGRLIANPIFVRREPAP